MKAYLGLGSNEGDRFALLREAAERLDGTDGISVTAASSIYETEPVGVAGQDDYLNAVLEIDTSLEPAGLLTICRSVESAMGRVRCERWGSRPIDIDILLIDGRVLETGELAVPHPRMHEREFVLRPLAELARERVHPVFGVTVDALLEKSSGMHGVRKVSAFYTGENADE